MDVSWKLEGLLSYASWFSMNYGSQEGLLRAFMGSPEPGGLGGRAARRILREAEKWMLEDIGPGGLAALALAAAGGRVEKAGEYIVVYHPEECRRALELDLEASKWGGSLVYGLLRTAREGSTRLSSLLDTARSILANPLLLPLRIEQLPLLAVAGVDPSTGKAFVAVPPRTACVALAAWTLGGRPVEEWLVREILGFDLHPWEYHERGRWIGYEECGDDVMVSGPRVRVQGDLVVEMHCRTEDPADPVRAALALSAAAATAESLVLSIRKWLAKDAILAGWGAPEAMPSLLGPDPGRAARWIMAMIEKRLPGFGEILGIRPSQLHSEFYDTFRAFTPSGLVPVEVALEASPSEPLGLLRGHVGTGLVGDEDIDIILIQNILQHAYDLSIRVIRIPPLDDPLVTLSTRGEDGTRLLLIVSIRNLLTSLAMIVLQAASGRWPGGRPPEWLSREVQRRMEAAGPLDVTISLGRHEVSFRGGAASGPVVDTLYAAGRLAKAARLIDPDLAWELLEDRNSMERSVSFLADDREAAESLARALARIASARRGVALAWSESLIQIDHPEHGATALPPLPAAFWITGLALHDPDRLFSQPPPRAGRVSRLLQALDTVAGIIASRISNLF